MAGHTRSGARRAFLDPDGPVEALGVAAHDDLAFSGRASRQGAGESSSDQ